MSHRKARADVACAEEKRTDIEHHQGGSCIEKRKEHDIAHSPNKHDSLHGDSIDQSRNDKSYKSRCQIEHREHQSHLGKLCTRLLA